MKKTLLLSVLLTLAVGLFAQDALITFTKTEHDFGKINEDDGRVTHEFEFKNVCMEPILLTNVRASCGCTTPQWPKEPIAPGQVGKITVTYNPKGRPGKFNKTVTVNYVKASNSTNAEVLKLTIRGEVIAASAKPANQYVVKMGDLSLKSKNMNFSKMKMGTNKTMTIQYANLTDHVVTVGLRVNQADQDFLATQLSFETLKPKEEGTLNINFDTKKCGQYGPFSTKVYVVVNGDFKQEETYAIAINADVEEDFSTLTQEQLQAAPILEYTKEVNFGTIAAGQKASKVVDVKNVGTNPLIIRRIVNKADIINLNIKKTKLTLKSGKATSFVVEVDATNAKAGNYTRQIEVITNDPKQSRVKVVLRWTVE